jgi:energy-coupling factor transporter ATP-binding protein EcfA2
VKIIAPIVEVKDVKKSCRLGKTSVLALVGVSFDVEKVEFLTIFGPSGSRKSMLLHLIGGLGCLDEGARKWTVIAFVYSIGVCLVFGLYPARKAAKLDPCRLLDTNNKTYIHAQSILPLAGPTERRNRKSRFSPTKPLRSGGWFRVKDERAHDETRDATSFS